MPSIMPSTRAVNESKPSIELETLIARNITATQQHAINKYGFVTRNSVVGDSDSDKFNENDVKSLKM